MDNQKYQTGFKRLGAAIVDGIVFIPFLFFDEWLLGKTQNNSVIISWIIFTTFLTLFYSIFAHYKYGRTIGKWVVGVKVLDVSETKLLTFRQSVLRDCFYLAIEFFGLIYFVFLVLQTGKTEYILNDYKSFADQPILWWTIIELVSMLTNSKRRAVHDFLARSVVIRA